MIITTFILTLSTHSKHKIIYYETGELRNNINKN